MFDLRTSIRHGTETPAAGRNVIVPPALCGHLYVRHLYRRNHHLLDQSM